MTEQKRLNSRLIASAGLALVVAVAGCSSSSSKKAPIDYRGSNPAGGTDTTAATSSGDGSGLVVNGEDRYVVAESGDTVTTLAKRHGLSASELGGYNGLTPTSPLAPGQDLVVPPNAVAAGTGAADTRVADSREIFRETTTDANSANRAVDGTGGVAVGADGSLATNTTGGAAAATTDGTGTTPVWSPDLAAKAIERSGTDTRNDAKTGLNTDGSLAAPPSSKEPVPESPTDARALKSPGLGQYQTKASSGDPAATSDRDDSTDVAAVDTRAGGGAGGIKLTRPVQGPVAVGFGEGSGPAKNDGVDFAAPAGAPVVAAADGEVALVSETLGGLGTIVLVRHKDELLTVYGRIDNVGVKKGDIVQRGQKIGVVSAAGAPAKPRMHFEVRRGATVLDPMRFL